MRNLLTLLTIFICAAPALADSARDARVVETLLRLKSIDVNQREDLKAAVLRYLEPLEGTAKYVDLVRQLKLRGVESQLLDLAVANPDGNAGVQAATLLLERSELDRFQAALDGDDQPRALAVTKVLGMVGGKEAHNLLRPLITSDRASRAIRNAAASGLGRGRGGQQYLLKLVQDGALPDDLKFTVTNALFSSPDPTVRQEAAKHLELPAGADSKPLPPVSELVQMAGDHQRGKELYNTKGTCNKCHKVRGEGKEVGPDLSEIGSKLTPEANFISILDPSAGISHNYEMYSAVTVDGQVVSGLKVSETDASITLRSAEAIDKVLSQEEIDEIIKSETSLMPADLQKLLTAQELADIVAYLQTLKKET